MDKVKTLLSSGAAVRARDHAGNEPLHYAVLSSMADMVQLLVKSGANPDGKGQANRFPLHTAVSKSSLRIIKMLLAQGVDISAQDDLGDTPLHLALPPAVALEPGRVPPIIRVLVEFGCELNKPNAAGITPFLKFLASPHESPDPTDREFRAYNDLVLFFLRHGGSVTTALPDGRTPLQLFLARWGDDQNRLFNGEGPKVLSRSSKEEPWLKRQRGQETHWWCTCCKTAAPSTSTTKDWRPWSAAAWTQNWTLGAETRICTWP